MRRLLLSTCVLAAAVPTQSAVGQPAEIRGNANRLSLGPRVGLNFTASFHNHRSQSNPGLPIGGVDHDYDDGYVHVDSSGPTSGGTWNWGYQNASQVSGGTMVFHSDQLATIPLEIEEDSDDVQPGMELLYQRVIGRFFLKGRWGLEAAIGYTDFDIEDRRSVSGIMTHLTDTYALNGVIPPTAPYNGSFGGPGPVLNDLPTRTTPTETAFTSGRQQLSGYAVGIRVGPFFEWNLTKRLALALSGGLVLAPTKMEYDFSETTTIGAGAPITTRGTSDTTDLLYGNYVGGTLRYDFTRQWGAFVGAQFQTLNDLENTIAKRTATLEQDSTFYGVLGVSWTF